MHTSIGHTLEEVHQAMDETAANEFTLSVEAVLQSWHTADGIKIDRDSRERLVRFILNQAITMVEAASLEDGTGLLDALREEKSWLPEWMRNLPN